MLEVFKLSNSFRIATLLSRTALVYLGTMFVIVILGILLMYLRMAAPSNELHDQIQALIQTLIQTHDVTKIKALSIDDSTNKFLLGLPKDVSINASDFQGGGRPHLGVEIGYFPAEVGGQMLNCYMVLNTHSLSLIPHWKLVKVSMNPVVIDPNWAQVTN